MVEFCNAFNMVRSERNRRERERERKREREREREREIWFEVIEQLRLQRSKDRGKNPHRITKLYRTSYLS